MPELLEAELFILKSGEIPVIDVRSPVEYVQGHIPGAHNIPLFTDDERAEIGTIYKHVNREAAIKKGVEHARPKLKWYVEQSQKVARNNEILVHCWRGGMRSESFAGLCKTAGMKVSLLEGGYKAYRRSIRKNFQKCQNLIVLAGMTGCGKTEILHELEKLGEQVVDLEGFANHKGSAFGFIGQKRQPTNEQFENDIAGVWQNFDMTKRIWIESESLRIGKVVINEALFAKMRAAFAYIIEVSDSVRINRLERDYCNFPADELIALVAKIEDRLGSQSANKVIEFLENDQCRQAIAVLLNYYSKSYLYGIKKREQTHIHTLQFDDQDSSPDFIAKKLIEFDTLKHSH